MNSPEPSTAAPTPAATTSSTDDDKPLGGWRLRGWQIIYESDTALGRLFDKILIALIVVSVAVVMADSVESITRTYGKALTVIEWGFTLLFTAEYVARLLCTRKPWAYATSFFGIIDFVAVLPTYLAIFFPEMHVLIDVRVLRLLRVFRIFRLAEYVSEYQSMGRALAASRRKILVFLSAVLMLVMVLGTVMYVVEGREHGFTSIPTSIYWAISTVTTVGFGDIAPKTDLGRFIASCMMLLGWGILAVPTGIVTAEMAMERRRQRQQKPFQPQTLVPALPSTPLRSCSDCQTLAATPVAMYCWHCGSQLPPGDASQSKDAL